jgi:plasmid stabilization system protein ParE
VLTLVWRASAREDVRTAISFIAERNAIAAAALQDLIGACAERLVEHPFMYRPGRVNGTREAVVHPNYILVYRITAEAVEIVNLVHARRQYP